MSITRYRQEFKPFEYPIFGQIYQRAKLSQWVETEVSMDRDYRDWATFSPSEKRVIAGILNGFTILETHISDYWSDFVPKHFPKHEIVSMARWFAAQERVHADAYSHLIDTLGLQELHVSFIGDPVVQKKLEVFLNPEEGSVLSSLGVFSGAGEGVSLFGSFSVLYSFAREGKLNGLRQLISWSILDEQLHSDAASLLFRILVQEQGGLSKEDSERIYEGFDLVLRNEDAFLDSIFEENLVNLTKESVQQFLRQRANNRLCLLGLQPIYTYNKQEADKILSWFAPLSLGVVDSDFFASSKEGSGYTARPQQQFDISLLQSLDL
jgi:ribonucleoside-diphosphate reductase beta chain